MLKRNYLLTGFLAFLLAIPAVGTAGAEDLNEYRERAKNSANVLEEIMGIREDGIPEELMARATAIAVIPHVVK